PVKLPPVVLAVVEGRIGVPFDIAAVVVDEALDAARVASRRQARHPGERHVFEHRLAQVDLSNVESQIVESLHRDAVTGIPNQATVTDVSAEAADRRHHHGVSGAHLGTTPYGRGDTATPAAATTSGSRSVWCTTRTGCPRSKPCAACSSSVGSRAVTL